MIVRRLVAIISVLLCTCALATGGCGTEESSRATTVTASLSEENVSEPVGIATDLVTPTTTSETATIAGAPSTTEPPASTDAALFLACIYDGPHDGLFGYINKAGEWVIQPQFYWAMDFSEGLAAVVLAEGGPLGFVDETGEVVIQPQFCLAPYEFSDGVAVVREPATQDLGYINKAGEFVLEPQTSWCLPFSEGLAAVRLKSQAGVAYIDATGQVVIQTEFWTAEGFSGGLARVQPMRDGPWGYIDKTGSLVIQPQFQFGAHMSGYLPGDFSEGLARVQLAKNGPSGYIDKTGKPVIRPQFFEARNFSEGLAAVQPVEDGLWAYIDPAGGFALQPQFAFATDFSEGVAWVWGPDERGPLLIDKAGEVLSKGEQLDDPEHIWPSSFSNGLAALVETEGGRLWGYMDKTGEVVFRSRVEPEPSTPSSATESPGVAIHPDPDAPAKSLVRNAMTAIEAAFVDLRTFVPTTMTPAVLAAYERETTFIAVADASAATAPTAEQVVGAVNYYGTVSTYAVGTVSQSGTAYGAIVEKGAGEDVTFYVDGVAQDW